MLTTLIDLVSEEGQHRQVDLSQHVFVEVLTEGVIRPWSTTTSFQDES
jgi:hypothetical protein